MTITVDAEHDQAPADVLGGVPTVTAEVEAEKTWVVPNRADRRRYATKGTHRMPRTSAKRTGAHWAKGLYLRRVLSGQALRLQAIRDRWDSRQERN